MQELLTNFRKHVTISQKEVEHFMTIAPPKRVKKNAFIIKQNEGISPLILVKNGLMMTFHEDENKMKHVIQFSQMGWWTGDFNSFNLETPSNYSVKAMGDITYCSLNLETYERVCREIPVLETYFRRLYLQAIVSHQNRIISNIALTAERRYEEFIDSYPSVEQMVAQKYIASYLGMSPEFLSKIKARRYSTGK